MTAHTLHAPPSAAVAAPRAIKRSRSTSTTAATVSDTRVDRAEQHETDTAVDSSDEEAGDAEAEAEAARFALWRAHSEHHFAVRKAMIARLQRLHPLLATDATMQYAGQFTRIPELVQRLELMLYKAAASLDEYTNLCTLERRVHSLVTLLEPLPAPATAALQRVHKRASPAAVAPRKRRRRAVSWTAGVASSIAPSTAAAPIASWTTPSTATAATATTTTVSAPARNRLATELSADLLAHVFGFVDGVDTLARVARVSRFFRREAPRLVHTLRLDVADPCHANALRRRVRDVLAPCTNLETLVITNSRNLGKKTGGGFTRAAACHDDHHTEGHHEGDGMAVFVAPTTATTSSTAPHFTGRELLHELRALWLSSSGPGNAVAFPKLRRLELRAPFDAANEAEATLASLHALARHLDVCSTGPPALRALVLDTTLLGDRRVARLCALFRAFPRVFTYALRELELRNNFVGEAGAAALCRTLAARDSWRALERLALPRNILTDGDAAALARCVGTIGEDENAGESVALPRLAELDVRENFIGKPGFEALAGGVLRRRGERVAVATASNCMESSEAARLFR